MFIKIYIVHQLSESHSLENKTTTTTLPKVSTLEIVRMHQNNEASLWVFGSIGRRRAQIGQRVGFKVWYRLSLGISLIKNINQKQG